MCKDVRNSYIVQKLGIQRVPYDIRNYAVMRVFGKMSWGYYAGLRFPKTGHPANCAFQCCITCKMSTACKPQVISKVSHFQTSHEKDDTLCISNQK